MEQMTATGLKEFIGIVMAACTLLSIGATWAGFYVLTKFRLDRLDKVVFGNGKEGLVEIQSDNVARLDTIEAICKERHGHQAHAGAQS